MKNYVCLGYDMRLMMAWFGETNIGRVVKRGLIPRALHKWKGEPDTVQDQQRPCIEARQQGLAVTSVIMPEMPTEQLSNQSKV